MSRSVSEKNCTFVEEGVAAFPDAITDRGLKHLIELQNLLSKRSRCVMFYLIQRMDVVVFKPADRIDPAYGQMLRQAVSNAVEIMAYDVSIDLKTIGLNRRISLMIMENSDIHK
jgi:sugar fermentation stimulation protein A